MMKKDEAIMGNAIDTKRCTRCQEEKPATVEYFYRETRVKSGLSSQCKGCNKKYREENREKIKARDKKYREENPEKIKARSKKYYEENTEKKKASNKKYCKENPEKVRAAHKKYMRQRRQQDPIFRILHNMCGNLSRCLSGKTKNSHTMEYVGMTPDELMDYLEGRFTEGMTRDNYGEWHADHIRPLASFGFYQEGRFEEGSKEFEDLLHIANHYTNFQPLWATDNISKGAKYEEG